MTLLRNYWCCCRAKEVQHGMPTPNHAAIPTKMKSTWHSCGNPSLQIYVRMYMENPRVVIARRLRVGSAALKRVIMPGPMTPYIIRRAVSASMATAVSAAHRSVWCSVRSTGLCANKSAMVPGPTAGLATIIRERRSAEMLQGGPA